MPGRSNRFGGRPLGPFEPTPAPAQTPGAAPQGYVWDPNNPGANAAEAYRQAGVYEQDILGEARSITGQENQINARLRDFMSQQFEAADAPTYTQADLEREYGRASDQASADSQEMMRALREHLGAAGVRGGAAGALGAQVELQRLGQLTGARRDLRIFKAQADAQDRIQRYQRAMGYTAATSELGPSPFYADVLGSLFQAKLGQAGIERGYQAAKESAKAAKKSSKFGFLDVLGLATSVIPGIPDISKLFGD